jgi:hypothetical protein
LSDWSAAFRIATIVAMPPSPMAVDRLTPTCRRTLRLGISVLLAVGALLALGASSALADAGNPIIGTTKGDLVQNPDGTVTVYVRGQWNWLSHKNDCNFDRAATGLSMIWNDPTETGYTMTGKTISADVGVKSKNGSWADPNLIDGMVHPVDRGNIPEGLPGVTDPPFEADQTFVDPAPQAAGQTHPTATWRGGCGREPLSHVDAFTGFPWGSWGYEKSSLGSDGNIHLGYSHVYRSLSFVPKSVCVNFYDVHGGGDDDDPKFQVPSNSDSLDVLANGDNSIEENDFDVNGGSCVHFAKITTSATPSVKLGESITDTAKITDAVTNKTAATDGTVTFRAYRDPTTCTGAAAFTSGPTAVNLDAGSEVTSAPFTPSTAGTYYWIATYHSTADPQATDTSTTCKEVGETSVVVAPPEETIITPPPAGGVAGVKKASPIPPPECKLRKARARVFIYTRHNRVRLVIRYVAYTRAQVTTSYTLHGSKGGLFLGKATQTFKKKSVFRLPKKLTPKNMKKVRAASEFDVQFQIPGTPEFCQRFFKRKLTVARFVEGQKVWFQTGSVFGGDV